MGSLSGWQTIVSLLRVGLGVFNFNPDQILFLEGEDLELQLTPQSKVQIKRSSFNQSEVPLPGTRASLEEILPVASGYQVYRWVPQYGAFQFFCECANEDDLIMPTITALFARAVSKAVEQTKTEWAREDVVQSVAADILAELLEESPGDTTFPADPPF